MSKVLGITNPALMSMTAPVDRTIGIPQQTGTAYASSGDEFVGGKPPAAPTMEGSTASVSARPYADFAATNHQLTPDMDLVDYMWRTASMDTKETPEMWAPSALLRLSLFKALDTLPPEGPTFEDACLVTEMMGRTLYANDRFEAYVTAEVQKRNPWTECFAPGGDDIFYEMILHQCLRELPRDRIEDMFERSAAVMMGPQAFDLMSAVYEQLEVDERASVSQRLVDWYSSENKKREIAQTIISSGINEGLGILLENEYGFDFGQYTARVTQQHISNGIHMINVPTKHFSFLLR